MLEKGDTFLRKDQIARIALQNKWARMYYSEEVYQSVVKADGVKTPVDPLVPLPNTVSEIFSDLLFLEFPNITFGDGDNTQEVDDVLNKIRIQVLEAAGLCSAQGMLWWYMFLEDGVVKWKFIQPNMTVWVKDALGDLKLFRLFKEMESKNKGKKDFFIQEYEKTRTEGENARDIVIYSEYTITTSNDDRFEVEKVFIEKTEIFSHDFIPVIEVLNMGQLGSPIGKSDYQGKEQLFAEIDNRIDQINNVLQEHADPWSFIPAGILDMNGNIQRGSGRMVEKAPGGQADNTVEFSTWDASLQAAFDQIKQMVKMIFFTSRISSPIAGLEEGGGVESGRALKWRSINTFSSVARRQIYWGDSFQKFFNYLEQMDPSIKLDINKFSIEWFDGLPLDVAGVTETVINQVNAGLKSKLTGTKETQDLDDSDAQKEQDQIVKEQTTEAEVNNLSTAPIQF